MIICPTLKNSRKKAAWQPYGSAHAQIKCTVRQASHFSFAHKGAYPAPQACRPKSRNPLKQAVIPSCQKKRMWQPYGSTHAQIFSAPHGRLSAPALLKRELTPPHKLAVIKAETP